MSRFQLLISIHCSRDHVIWWDQQKFSTQYYNDKKERIIHLLLHILFTLGLISVYTNNLTYYYVITALMSINAFLLIDGVSLMSILTWINNIVVDLIHVCSSKRKLNL